MTVSTDGMVLWWDIRRMNEAVESMPLRCGGACWPAVDGLCNVLCSAVNWQLARSGWVMHRSKTRHLKARTVQQDPQIPQTPPHTQPTLPREKGSDVLLGGLCLEYDPQAGPTKFMVGTEQGTVLSCNRKAKNPADRVGTSFGGHHGPVQGVWR
jgi:hypothetical protein